MFQTLFVEKRPSFESEAKHLLHDLRESLNLPNLCSLRLLNRYDIEGVSTEEFAQTSATILSEPQTDTTSTDLTIAENETAFAFSYFPGQFDQRADSAAQCIQILTGKDKPTVYASQIVILTGKISKDQLIAIKSYIINPVDSHETAVAVTFGHQSSTESPPDVPILKDFLTDSPEAIREEMALAMSEADIAFTQDYFKNEENRAPSLTEIRMLDTYWSDHCRHTTFLTAIDDITFAPGTEVIKESYETYRSVRKTLGRDEKPVTLMDIALIGMRELKASGELDNLEVSEEINAASIVVPVTRSIDSSNLLQHLLSDESLTRLPENLARQARTFREAAHHARNGRGSGQSGSEADGKHVEWAARENQIVSEGFFAPFGDPISNYTSEHQIWFDESQARAVKRTWPGGFGQIPIAAADAEAVDRASADLSAYLFRMALHIAIFGSDLKFEGIHVSPEAGIIIGQALDQPSAVVSQEWVHAADPEKAAPSFREIAAFMVDRGFTSVPNSFFGWMRPDGLTVIDAKPDNFILTENGVIPIDLQIAFIPKSSVEEWLVQFKNETHNHPTEIEPFGGAATCLGGCIRDPLSGRSYVYQAMRVTGAANPLTPFSETLPGKLPQKKICQVAAKGYSSYGNQIGLATGQVAEVYHPGYVAKRLEIGAVVAASPRSNVFRGSPSPGDVILLIGGRTGRDGVGGATGSSKEHTDTALENSAEVQKGDAPTERKIQRLFRNPELTRKIKICNDFGAGGVSVAIGEIAPSLIINLDAVPKKYDGLDGTELAISESQERMAVCVDPSEIDFFIHEADKENLECVHVADVTDSGRLIMTWRGKEIVNLSRAFLDTNGVQQTAAVEVISPTSTPNVKLNHEQRTNLLERIPQETLRASLGPASQAVSEIFGRVGEAGKKSGITVPKTKAERYELHRALEEREIRRRLSDLFLNAAEFEQKWKSTGSLGGAEQRVFPDGNGSYLKANSGAYHGHWAQYFDRLNYHRILFPDTAYTFLGFVDIEGEFCFVTSQPEAYSMLDPDGEFVPATRVQIEKHMASLGAFRFRNDDYYLPAEDLFIEDLHDENVLLGTDGHTLRFIDPVIFRRPADLPIPSSLPSTLSALRFTSQKGLGEMFDGSVGANTVLWPFGGKHQLTPPDAMVAKLPLLEGETDSATYMAWGFDPYLSEKSPFHGAAYAVTESVCKAVAAGACLSDIRLTLQEYFPRLGNDPKRWGLPFAALLGAFRAQHELRLAAIGGKDSMSGSFNELDVPPTLVSFALAPGLASLAISPEFKQQGSTVSLIETPILENGLPDFETLKATAESLHQLNRSGKILALHHIGAPGIAAALTKMCLGNGIGFAWSADFSPPPSSYFAFLIEHETNLTLPHSKQIGNTTAEKTLIINGETHSLTDLESAYTSTLEPIYPTSPEIRDSRSKIVEIPTPKSLSFNIQHSKTKISRPSVLIPAFPGTNSEYDSARAFQRVGAATQIQVFRNLSASHIEQSISSLAEKIKCSQILFIPGGFSAGDEPDGSAKFIATILRNPRVSDAISDLLENRDGLILGICNGFQALIKTGLVSYGKISNFKSQISNSSSPTLVHNDISRHISQYVQTRVANNASPWLSNMAVGEIHTVPVSHGEGKFFAPESVIAELSANGQIATQYCNPDGAPTMQHPFNPNGSLAAIEGITSPCGKVFGKMAHSERYSESVAKNIPGNKSQPIFQAGVSYFS